MLVLPLCPDRDYLGLLRHLTGWSVVRANANNFWSNELSWQSVCDNFPLKMKCIGKLRALEFQQVCNDCWNVHTKSSPSESDKQHVCGLEAWLSKISHVLDNSYAGGFNILKRRLFIRQVFNTCLINRRLATHYPIVRLFTSRWKKLIAQLRWEFVTPV